MLTVVAGRAAVPSRDAATEAAARRARQQATVVASVAAVVPTVLAAQGMTSLAMDLLGFAPMVALALACFLELALISSALLARASALAGRPGGADAAAVWVVSAASGVLAGAHELVGPEVAGVRAWETDPGSLLAATLRVIAPLVAARLWDRVLTAARHEHAARTLTEIRRDHRLLAVARAALMVRRLEASGRAAGWRGRLARRRLDRAHIAALRAVPPGPELLTVLTAVGAVDTLPDATRVLSAGARPVSDASASLSDTRRAVSDAGADLTDVDQLSDGSERVSDGRVSDASERVSDGRVSVSDTSTWTDRPAATTAVRRLVSDTGVSAPARMADTTTSGVSDSAAVAVDDGPNLSDTADSIDSRWREVVSELSRPEVMSDRPERVSDSEVSDRPERVSDSEVSAASDTVDPVQVAIELVRRDREVSGARVAQELRARGVAVTDRTGLRYRTRAVTRLREEGFAI